MKRVPTREFIQYTSRYMAELPVIITYRGQDHLILKEVDMVEVYGCGCKKTDNKLCKKHNRT